MPYAPSAHPARARSLLAAAYMLSLLACLVLIAQGVMPGLVGVILFLVLCVGLALGLISLTLLHHNPDRSDQLHFISGVLLFVCLAGGTIALRAQRWW